MRFQIKSFTLTAGALAPDQRKYVEIVRDHATRLTETVNELLHAARLQAGSVELQPEPLDVHAVVAEVATGLQPLARERSIRLEVHGSEARGAADREKLRRAVENLISNALKFTDDKGEVIVEVSANRDAIEVTVCDTGHGIPAEEFPRLFERFYRGSTRKPGTGHRRVVSTGPLHGPAISANWPMFWSAPSCWALAT